MPSGLEFFDHIDDADRRIGPHIRRTCLEHSQWFSEMTGVNVYFKCENLQHTGSFKLRGALNRFLLLAPEQQQKGIVTASTGNHGKAVAWTARKFSARAIVFVPEESDSGKVQAIRNLGAEVRVAGSDCVESEHAARSYANQTEATYISPYNDLAVVAGQGVIGREIADQLSEVDAVFASMGGAGLVSGIGSYLTWKVPDCQIIACSPENSKVMVESLRAGKLLDLPSTETLSDGTAGGVEAGSITFELAREVVDRCLTVTEAEIRESLCQYMATHSRLIEGAAAVALAGFLKHCDEFHGKNVVVVLCGANIGLRKLVEVIEQNQLEASK